MNLDDLLLNYQTIRPSSMGIRSLYTIVDRQIILIPIDDLLNDWMMLEIVLDDVRWISTFVGEQKHHGDFP